MTLLGKVPGQLGEAELKPEAFFFDRRYRTCTTVCQTPLSRAATSTVGCAGYMCGGRYTVFSRPFKMLLQCQNGSCHSAGPKVSVKVFFLSFLSSWT